MQNLFVSKDDEFVVDFSVATDEKGTLYCDVSEETLKILLEEIKQQDNFVIQSYKVVFKKPSFGDTIGLYDSIFSVNGTDGINVNFNPVATRHKKINSLIKSWNLNGVDEKPTEENIQDLHPVIATVIGVQVDLETGGLLQ
jgi:hypothetical protein